MSWFVAPRFWGLECTYMEILAPEVRDFILFCAERGSAEWPAIYDEMTRVAGRRLFRGLGYRELRELGLSFSLSSMDRTIGLVQQTMLQYRGGAVLLQAERSGMAGCDVETRLP